MKPTLLAATLAALVACDLGPAADPVDDTAPSAGEEPAEVETGAGDAPFLILTDLQLTDDADGDWRWESGERAMLRVNLVNTSVEDYMQYPGVVVETSDDRVRIDGPPEWWLYGIFGRTSQPVEVPVIADVPAGTEVTFTLRSSSLGCFNGPAEACVAEDELSLTVTVE